MRAGQSSVVHQGVVVEEETTADVKCNEDIYWRRIVFVVVVVKLNFP